MIEVIKSTKQQLLRNHNMQLMGDVIAKALIKASNAYMKHYSFIR